MYNRLHYSRIFEVENWDFWKAADPVLVKRTKTETFENDGVAAHIRTAYPWRPLKQ